MLHWLKRNRSRIYVCRHNCYYQECFKQENLGVMNGTHTFHNSGGVFFFLSLSLKQPRLKNKETLSLREEKSSPLHHCLVSSLSLSCLSVSPSVIYFFFFFSPFTPLLLICRVIYMSSLAHTKQPQNGKIPLGEVVTAG